MRINKFLSDSGICSRRQADALIARQKVKVNGQIATLGQNISETDDVVVEGQKVAPKATQKVYYALYKPKNYITTCSDENDRRTVLQLVPKQPRVYPVGRLDRNSEGLLILTNDGELTNELTHPSFDHGKRYKVKATPFFTGNLALLAEKVKKSFLEGILIENILMKADFVEIELMEGNILNIDLTIHTGYNRQIRKMCDKMKLEILRLVRTKVGKVDLKKLGINSGQYVTLRKEDIL